MGHRRTRSIESSGSGVLSEPADAFRVELERIGSASMKASNASPATAELSSASSAGSAAASGLGLGSGPALAPTAAQGQEAARGTGAARRLSLNPRPDPKETELISWDELEVQRDVYRAVTTKDGRQALIRSPSGACPFCHS